MMMARGLFFIDLLIFHRRISSILEIGRRAVNCLKFIWNIKRCEQIINYSQMQFLILNYRFGMTAFEFGLEVHSKKKKPAAKRLMSLPNSRMSENDIENERARETEKSRSKSLLIMFITMNSIQFPIPPSLRL